MQPKGLREDRKKIDEAIRNRKITMSVGINFPALPKYLSFLEASGVSDSLAQVEVNRQRKCMEHMEVFPVLYLAKIMVGIQSLRGAREILTNKAAMTMLGFTANEIKEGITKRGQANQYGEGFERRSPVVSEEAIIDNIAAYDHKEIIEKVFDPFVRWVVQNQCVELGDTCILDSTLIETPRDYPGAKATRRIEEDEDGNSNEKTVHGFKVFLLIDAKTQLPLAMEITTAEKADCKYLRSMLEKGIANVGEGVIKLILADRGFIDGEQMWRIKNELNVDFIIPAKKNMEIWKDVVGLRHSHENEVVMWPYGKQGQSGGFLVEGAVSYSQYAQVLCSKGLYNDGDPLTAVVVTHWRDKPIAAGKEKVLLTTLTATNAVQVMKSYRMRTLIENCGFREMKQAAFLNRLPQRKGVQAERSAYAHMSLCVLAFVSFIGFLSWTTQNIHDAQEASLAHKKRMREYRVDDRSNDGYVFIYHEGAYAIYETKELLSMMGMIFDT